MKKNMELDKETQYKIVSLYAQGNSLREIDRQVGISYSTIKKILERLGLYRYDKDGCIYKGNQPKSQHQPIVSILVMIHLPL